MTPQTLTFTTANWATAQAVSSSIWAAEIIVQNDTPVTAWIASSGSVAMADGASCEPPEAGETGSYGNSAQPAQSERERRPRERRGLDRAGLHAGHIGVRGPGQQPGNHRNHNDHLRVVGTRTRS
jgi:hypothetical protein